MKKQPPLPIVQIIVRRGIVEGALTTVPMMVEIYDHDCTDNYGEPIPEAIVPRPVPRGIRRRIRKSWSDWFHRQYETCEA